MDDLIKEMAEQIQMSQEDIKCFCQSMLNSMKKDGLTIDQLDRQAVEAYAVAAVKKMQSFTNTYFTNPEARKKIQEKVINDLHCDTN